MAQTSFGQTGIHETWRPGSSDNNIKRDPPPHQSALDAGPTDATPTLNYEGTPEPGQILSEPEDSVPANNGSSSKANLPTRTQSPRERRPALPIRPVTSYRESRDPRDRGGDRPRVRSPSPVRGYRSRDRSPPLPPHNAAPPPPPSPLYRSSRDGSRRSRSPPPAPRRDESRSRDRRPSPSTSRRRSLSWDRYRSRDDYRSRRTPSPPSTRRKSRSRSRDRGANGRMSSDTWKGKGRDTSGSMTEALDAFTKNIYTALLSTSAHTLVAQKLARLITFQPTPNTHINIVEARKDVGEAEKRLHADMVKLQDSFISLMSKVVQNRGDTVDIDKLELDAVKGRLKRLEGLISSSNSNIGTGAAGPTAPTIPTGPRNAAPGPSSRSGSLIDIDMRDSSAGDAAEGEQPRRQVRVRDVLKEMVRRLNKLEDHKEAVIDRVDDLENLIWEQAENQVEFPRTWAQFEEQRIKQIRQRVRKEKQPENTNLEQPIQGQASTSELKVPEPSVDVTMAPVDPPAANNSTVSSDNSDVAALRQQVTALQKEVADLRDEREQREQKLILGLRAEYAEVVKKELQRVASNFRQRHPESIVEAGNPALASPAAPQHLNGPASHSSPSVPAVPQLSMQSPNMPQQNIISPGWQNAQLPSMVGQMNNGSNTIVR